MPGSLLNALITQPLHGSSVQLLSDIPPGERGSSWSPRAWRQGEQGLRPRGQFCGAPEGGTPAAPALPGDAAGASSPIQSIPPGSPERQRPGQRHRGRGGRGSRLAFRAAPRAGAGPRGPRRFLTATGSPAEPRTASRRRPSPPVLTLEVGVGVLVAAVGLLFAVGLRLHGLPVEAHHPAAAGRLLLAGIPPAGEVVGGEAQQVGRPLPQHLHREALQQFGEARRDLDVHGAGHRGDRRLSPPPRPAVAVAGSGPPSAGAD